jgi:hypothetical protein
MPRAGAGWHRRPPSLAPSGRRCGTCSILLPIALALVAACAALREATPARGLSFALIGDAPYGAHEARRFDALIAQINADPAVAFVLHAGDLKGGTEPCSDALLRERVAQLQGFRRPVVLTPGDNDWTDCHRAAAGRHLPTERLAFLRRLAWRDPSRSLGAPTLALRSQADDPPTSAYVENTMFAQRGLVVAAIHVVGSNNGLHPWSGLDDADSATAPRPDRLREFSARQQAALAWLDRAFGLAAREHAAALVLLIHANPLLEAAPGTPARAGFEAFNDRLRRRVREFARPVLLAHGDHHVYKVDRPFAQVEPARERAPNLTRVQTYGSPMLGWVKVTYDPDGADVFRFSSRLESPQAD